MTSLAAVLPQPGSISWRSDRALGNGNDEAFYNEMQVRHVVISTTSIRKVPKPHVVYHVDVMTQSDRWTVLRRYSRFHALHQKMVKLHNIKKDSFPTKRLTGNLHPAFVEQRREALERYLQRLINSDRQIVFSPPLLEFLDVHSHDIVAVTQQMAEHVFVHGDAILERQLPFHMTPTQCRCANRRLALPMNSPTVADRGPQATLGTPSDPVHLFDFLHQIHSLCVHPRMDPDVPPSDMPVLGVTVDLSIFRSLTDLSISHNTLSTCKGFGTIQPTLKTMSCEYCQLKAMATALRDSVVERRAAPRNLAAAAEPWRQSALGRLTDQREHAQPWPVLQQVNLNFNRITQVDPECLELLPLLRELSLRGNSIHNLDAWLQRGTIVPLLNKLDLSENSFNSLSAPLRARDASFSSSLGTPPPSPARATPSGGKGIIVSPGWNLSESLPSMSSSLSEVWRPPVGSTPSPPSGEDAAASSAAPELPTRFNRPPPSYDAAHLISTDHPEASLDELQRMRSERLAKKQELPTGSARDNDEDDDDDDDDQSCSDSVTESDYSSIVDGSPALDTIPVPTVKSEGQGCVTPQPSESTPPASPPRTLSGDVFDAKIADATLESPMVRRGPSPSPSSSSVSSAGSGSAIAPRGLSMLAELRVHTGGCRGPCSSHPDLSLQNPTVTKTPPLSPHPSPPPQRALAAMRYMSISDEAPPPGFALAALAPQLTVLLLAHNQLTSLRGLERLGCLEILDVRHNKLATTKSISALTTQPKLLRLGLAGNPICSSKTYRAEVARHVLANPLEVTIDGSQVTEKQLQAVPVSSGRIAELVSPGPLSS
eukprot:m.105505 g.105505  ORF g.105505 m.105505 type:complete len:826 (+) comp9145_c0_seq2:393-2870(+)